MRILPVLLTAVALTALGSSFAFAYSSKNIHNASSAYTGCVCLYGYGSDGCREVVSCGAGGGRCIKACQLPADYSAH